MAQNNLDARGILWGTDKSSLGHGYLRHYERILAPFREQAVTIIEIGIEKGASLQMWSEHFPLSTIVGVDIRAECRDYAGERKLVEIGSQGDKEFLQGLGEKYKPTIIIDDGSHKADHVILTFEILYPHLQQGGVYIVEDVHFHSGRWAGIHRGSSPVAPQHYFLELANLTVCPEEELPFNPYLRHQTDSVEFFYGAIVVRKKEPPEPAAISKRRELVERANKAQTWSAFSTYVLNNGGDPSEALRAAKLAVQLNPKSPEHYHKLGIVLERIGDLHGALDAAEEAYKLHPTFELFPARVAELREKLEGPH